MRKKRLLPLRRITAALDCVEGLIQHPALTAPQRKIASQAAKYLESLKPATARPYDSQSLLTPGEVARRFHVHVVTVRGWASSGQIRCVTTPGGHRRFLISDVERFARQHRL